MLTGRRHFFTPVAVRLHQPRLTNTQMQCNYTYQLLQNYPALWLSRRSLSILHTENHGPCLRGRPPPRHVAVAIRRPVACKAPPRANCCSTYPAMNANYRSPPLCLRALHTCQVYFPACTTSTLTYPRAAQPPSRFVGLWTRSCPSLSTRPFFCFNC